MTNVFLTPLSQSLPYLENWPPICGTNNTAGHFKNWFVYELSSVTQGHTHTVYFYSRTRVRTKKLMLLTLLVFWACSICTGNLVHSKSVFKFNGCSEIYLQGPVAACCTFTSNCCVPATPGDTCTPGTLFQTYQHTSSRMKFVILATCYWPRHKEIWKIMGQRACWSISSIND